MAKFFLWSWSSPSFYFHKKSIMHHVQTQNSSLPITFVHLQSNNSKGLLSFLVSQYLFFIYLFIADWKGNWSVASEYLVKLTEFISWIRNDDSQYYCFPKRWDANKPNGFDGPGWILLFTYHLATWLWQGTNKKSYLFTKGTIFLRSMNLWFVIEI